MESLGGHRRFSRKRKWWRRGDSRADGECKQDACSCGFLFLRIFFFIPSPFEKWFSHEDMWMAWDWPWLGDVCLPVCLSICLSAPPLSAPQASEPCQFQLDLAPFSPSPSPSPYHSLSACTPEWFDYRGLLEISAPSLVNKSLSKTVLDTCKTFAWH